MDERLKQAGFHFAGSCRCIGPLTLKYIKGGMTVYYAPKRPNQLKIKQKREGTKFLTNDAEIEEFFKNQKA